MTSYKSFATLICDIEKYSEDNLFSQAENLIGKAREALRKDLRDHVEKKHNSRKPDIATGAPLHS